MQQKMPEENFTSGENYWQKKQILRKKMQYVVEINSTLNNKIK